MAKEKKSLCKWKKKDVKDHLGELKKVVKNPRFICGDCGRVANDKGCLCKPEKL